MIEIIIFAIGGAVTAILMMWKLPCFQFVRDNWSEVLGRK